MDDCFDFIASPDYNFKSLTTDSIMDFFHKYRNLSTNFAGLKATIDDWLLKVTLKKSPEVMRGDFETFLGNIPIKQHVQTF